jgi:TetR/AcrR family transcriptional repressor of nem operon
MRYPAHHKETTRKRIVQSASALFRKQGYSATGVDAVMAAAHLTAGGFYAHFRSKESLLARALDAAFQQSRDGWPDALSRKQGAAWVREFSGFYLSAAHRDLAEAGCPMPSLATEIARSGSAARAVFEEHLRDLIEVVVQRTGAAWNADSRSFAISAAAMSVGGLILARAVKDKDFSDEILGACRTALAAMAAERQNNSF